VKLVDARDSKSRDGNIMRVQVSPAAHMKKINHEINRVNLAYIVGIAMGDGNLSNPNGRATRLRITCDNKYPNLIRSILYSVRNIFPNNQVSLVKRKDNCVDISCYSNKLEGFLGWKVGFGSKHIQKISVPDWIKNDRKFTISCLKGLFETDGSIYIDRKYLMANFVTTIPSLAKDVIEMIRSLDFKPNIQKFKQKNGKTKHTIRISKNTKGFIKLVNIKKE
jgi:DNA-binding transcriptional regulator WhiA